MDSGLATLGPKRPGVSSSGNFNSTAGMMMGINAEATMNAVPPSIHQKNSSGRTSSMTSMTSKLFSRRKGNNNSGNKEKEEADVFLTDGEASMVNFCDLSSIRNTGGHKYGYGGGMNDTTPIIPTLVNRDGGKNMSTNDYRKMVNTQKKMVLSSAAKQQQQQQMGMYGASGRAMSLQSAPYGQVVAGIGPQGLPQQKYGPPRVAGAPPVNMGQGPGRLRAGSGVGPGPQVPIGPNGPRTMSLGGRGVPTRAGGSMQPMGMGAAPIMRTGPHDITAGAGASFVTGNGNMGNGFFPTSQQFNGRIPPPFQPQQQVSGGSPLASARTMSLQSHPRQSMYTGSAPLGAHVTPSSAGTAGVTVMGNRTGSGQPSSYGSFASGYSDSMRQSGGGTPLSSYTGEETVESDSSMRLKSPLENEIISEELPLSDTTGQLKVLKLSTPRQERMQSIEEREQELLKKERELQEREELLRREHELNLRQKQLDERERELQAISKSPHMAASETPIASPMTAHVMPISEEGIQQPSDATESDVDLNPSSVLVDSLNAVVLEDDFAKQFSWTQDGDALSNGAAVRETMLSPIKDISTNTSPRDMTNVADPNNASTNSPAIRNNGTFSPIPFNDLTPSVNHIKETNFDSNIAAPYVTARESPKLELSARPKLPSENGEGSMKLERRRRPPVPATEDTATKPNGFVKAKNFLRKLSTRQKEPSPAPSMQRSPSGTPKSSRRLSISNSLRSLRSDYDGLRRRENSVPFSDGGSCSTSGHNTPRTGRNSPIRGKSFPSLYSSSSGVHIPHVLSNCGTPTSRRSRSNSYFHEKTESRSRSATFTNLLTPTRHRSESSSNIRKSLLMEEDFDINLPLYQHNNSRTSIAAIATGDSALTPHEHSKYVSTPVVVPVIDGKPYPSTFASNTDELEPAFVFDHTNGKQDLANSKFKTILISAEQLSILTKNRTLVNELHIISQELAESVARETRLEQFIAKKESNNTSCSPDSEVSSAARNLEYLEFEVELRKKSAKIVELIQNLNDERLKRFIAEEQVLLHEHGVKPSTTELVYKIDRLEKQLQYKDNEIRQLKESINTKN